MKRIHVLDSFQFAFVMIQKNFQLLLALFTISGVLSFMNTIMNKVAYSNEEILISPSFSLIRLLVTIAIVIPAGINQILIIKVGLKGYDKTDRVVSFQEVIFSSVTSALSLFGRYCVVVLVLALLVMLGFIALVIPGILIYLVYCFVVFILIEHDLPARKVFRISEKLTHGIKWELFGYMLLIFVISIPVFFVGFYMPGQIIWWRDVLSVSLTTFIFGPLSIFSIIYIYKDVQNQQEALDNVVDSFANPEENDPS